ncbi:MAG TPA: PKD-like domain-containing protein, partial [Fibrella sp.]
TNGGTITGVSGNQITVSTPGTYVTQGRIYPGCSVLSSDTIRLTSIPIPTVNAVASQSICNGSPSAAVTFSGSQTATTYSWTNSNPAIGLASSGSGNIPSFTALNTGTISQTALITVTPSLSGCTGTPTTFTYTVFPTPTVNSVNSQTVCSGSTVGAIAFSSPVVGATFSYTSSANIGFGTTGIGTIASFVASNTTTAPITTTVTVRSTANGCQGPAQTFVIMVNPAPTVNAVASTTYCAGTVAPGFTFSSPTTGATFSYTSSVNVGFATNGSGNVPGFTATNSGSTPLVATVSVRATANGCLGPIQSFTVVINPIPTVSAVNNLTYCAGAPVSGISLSSPTPGATFSYTSTSNVGFPTTGSGVTSIPGFTATNATTSPVTTTVTVRATIGGCTGPATSFVVTVNPSPSVNTISSVTYCNGVSAPAISFSSPTTGAVFSYTSSVNVGFTTNGSGNIPGFTATNTGSTALVSAVTVQATANGCAGPTQSFSITVNPTPAVSNINSVTYCNGASAPAIPFASATPGATFSYTATTNVGFVTTGTNVTSIPGFTATNAGAIPVTTSVTVRATANGCTGPATTFTISVDPTPIVNAVSSASFCNGQSSTGFTFGSPTTGATFSYTSSINIGFGTSGSGNIPAFSADNTGSTPLVATVSVRAIANGCAGAVQTFSITVNPSPTVNPVTSATYCNGTTIPAVNFISPVTGATFSYTSSTNIGFGTSGTGSIPAFTGINNTAAPITTTVTVRATANGCQGPAQTFIVTISPSPSVNAVSNLTACNGQTASAISFSSPTAGATFSYNSSTDIGFGTAGVGNIGSFIAVNNTTAPITTTVTVTANANGCNGPSQSFVITVNPSPLVNGISSAAYCAGETASAISFSSPTAGATFSYTSSTNIGFGTSGTGNIVVFTTVNTTSAPITATVTVTATANGCQGSAQTFTVTVNPRPAVNAVANVVACAGQTASSISFSSPTAGATFSYTATNNVGFATTGTGAIGSFTAVNNGATPITSTVTVIATANGCSGTAQTFTIMVNPGPAVNAVSNVVVCNGAQAGS